MVRVSIATYLVGVLAVPVSAAAQTAPATSQQDQRERSVAAVQKTSIAEAASEQLRRSLIEGSGDTAVAPSADRQVSRRDLLLIYG